MIELTAAQIAPLVQGALETELDEGGLRPWRLRAVDRRYAHPALVLMSGFTAGVRLRFSSAATRLVLDADVARLLRYGHVAPNDSAHFVATADGTPVDERALDETGLIAVQGPGVVPPFRAAEPRYQRMEFVLGDSHGLPRVIELWFPQLASVRVRSLSADASIDPAPDERPRWIHYGSSISHGGSAGRPVSVWTVAAAAALELDLVSLGMSGNAVLDPVIARAIAREDADLITVKIGVNIVGGDSMRMRTFVPAVHGLLDTIRDRHPETPLVLISAIASPPLENEPGPSRTLPDGRTAATPREMSAGDGTLTLVETRRALAAVHEARRPHDPHLHLIDGLALLGLDESGLLPDLLHPDTAGHSLIAQRIVPQLRRILAL